MTAGERAPDRGPARGKGWAARLLGFVGAFLGLSLLAVQAAVLLGVSFSGDLTFAGAISLLVAAVLASWIFTRIERRPLSSLGLPWSRGGLRQLVAGAGVGVVLIGAVVVLLMVPGWLAWRPAPGPGSPLVSAALFAALLFLAAFVEELLFRGYPFQLLEGRFGAGVAIAATAIAFGAAHGANPGSTPLALLNIALAGVLLGIAYWRTRSLWFAIGVHLGWNWTMAVSEVSVSGLELEMPGFESELGGPSVWTGGGFGPEGGLLVTLASLVGMAWLLRRGPAEVASSRRSAEFDGPAGPAAALPGPGDEARAEDEGAGEGSGRIATSEGTNGAPTMRAMIVPGDA